MRVLAAYETTSMTPKRTYTKEADVKTEVKKLLAQHGWFHWMPPANGYGRSGIADIQALRDGVFLAIETKFGPRKPTPMQVQFLNAVTSHGGFGLVVSDRTLEWFAGFLAAFDRSRDAVATKTVPSADDGAYMLNAIDAMTQALRE
jgi:hypothetical protein